MNESSEIPQTESDANSHASEIVDMPARWKHLDYIRRRDVTSFTGREGIQKEERISYGKFFLGGRLSALYIVPERLKEDAQPLIFLPGYLSNASRKVAMPFAEELARTGREVYMLIQEGYHRWEHGMTPYPLQPPGSIDIPSIDDEKLALIEWYINQEEMKDKGKINLLAHSSAAGSTFS